MKYFKNKITGTIFEVIHRGENYVFGKIKGYPDTKGYTYQVLDGSWEEWTDELQVGDKVRFKGTMCAYDLLYIHDGGEIYNGDKWAVYTYKCDKPSSCRLSELEKVE